MRKMKLVKFDEGYDQCRAPEIEMLLQMVSSSMVVVRNERKEAELGDEG